MYNWPFLCLLWNKVKICWLLRLSWLLCQPGVSVVSVRLLEGQTCLLKSALACFLPLAWQEWRSNEEQQRRWCPNWVHAEEGRTLAELNREQLKLLMTSCRSVTQAWSKQCKDLQSHISAWDMWEWKTLEAIKTALCSLCPQRTPFVFYNSARAVLRWRSLKRSPRQKPSVNSVFKKNIGIVQTVCQYEAIWAVKLLLYEQCWWLTDRWRRSLLGQVM